MGVIAYAQRWGSFLGKYDHWRYLFAEWNKLAYLKSYRKYHSTSHLERSLHHSIRWLVKSIEQGNDAGSGTYYHTTGWTSSYPETTGYIIPTLLRYSKKKQAPWAREAEQKALEAGQWLLSIQHGDGGWPGGYVHQNRPSVVFNTGQILRGLLALYEHTQGKCYKDAAERAINWIWNQLDAQGKFSSNDFMGAVRVYGSYVVAPILEWRTYFPEQSDHWDALATRHLDWVLTQQRENFWFANCDNTIHKNHAPIIHTIAYTIDGLLDSGVLLKNDQYIQAASSAAAVLAQKFLKEGMLNGRYNSQWKGTEAFIPTGGAQLAIIWHKLIPQNPDWAASARDEMNTLLSVIASNSARAKSDVAGGLQGSFPMWGRYETFGLPNWATKYMADSLMNELNLGNEQ